jgi:hypothetical protein
VEEWIGTHRVQGRNAVVLDASVRVSDSLMRKTGDPVILSIKFMSMLVGIESVSGWRFCWGTRLENCRWPWLHKKVW